MINRHGPWRFLRRALGAAAMLGTGLLVSLLAAAPSAGAATSSAGPARALPVALSSSWCGVHGASFAEWADSSPNVAICGPGPDYGGGWNYVDLPGPGGVYAGYLNATPGFQCVELAERFLAVADGFSPVMANGASVAANYHAAYPRTALVVNDTSGAVGHAPRVGDVLSLSDSPSFYADDGHVAIVIGSHVNWATGDGTVVVAQENVSQADYRYTLDLAGWRLYDPSEPGNAEFQFPYAEWLHVTKLPQHPTGPSILFAPGPHSHPLSLSELAVPIRPQMNVLLSAFRPLAPRPLGRSETALQPARLPDLGRTIDRAPTIQPARTFELPRTLEPARTTELLRPRPLPIETPFASPLLVPHPSLDVRTVSGAGLASFLLGSSLLLVASGIRHRRLRRARHFAARSGASWPALRLTGATFALGLAPS